MTGPGMEVEFRDVDVSGDAGDLLEIGRAHRRPPRRPVRGRWVAALAVLALVGGVGVVVRARQQPPAETSSVTTVTAAPVTGAIRLPAGIGTLRQLVTTGNDDDVVWLLDHRAGIVRIERGRVTGVRLLDTPVTAIAVSSDGLRLFAALAATRPVVQEFDARSLAPGRSVRTPVLLQTLAVDAAYLWGVGSGLLVGLSEGSTGNDPALSANTISIALPGVLTADGLAAVSQSPDRSAVLSAVVTGTQNEGTRVLSVDTAFDAVLLSDGYAGPVSVAVTPLGTWVSAPVDGDPSSPHDNRTLELGASSLLPSGGQASVAPGGRIWPVRTGRAAFLSTAPGSPVVQCHDAGGFLAGTVDLSHGLPASEITGPVARTPFAFYAQTDVGLVRSGAGSCA